VTDAARVLAMLDAALALPSDRRAAYLDEHCASDAALRAQLESLLAHERESERFLQPIAAGTVDRSGEIVGPWRLLREIGHGGMGRVYLAERSDALYERRIALKLLRFDFGDLRARFANERRILAALDHPNIARLLDAGLDASGAPYVAMEFVEGEPVTCWCDANASDLDAIVALFLKILDAVQYAHGRLVVHRDIKPANLFVDARGEPKLLDFGIAKLIDADARGLTTTGAAPLTPEYASPEQVRGELVGTASDIYALGVLLYELVARERPYRIATTSPAEIERVVCGVEPRRPSLVGAAHGRKGIDRDLDHVILKALAKSPDERYASCAQFADDLERWRRGQAVLATDAGWARRAQRLVRRHRVPVAIGAAVALALIGSALVALRQARVADEQARIARVQRDRAEEVNAFLQGMLAAADPSDLGRKASVLDVVNRAERQAEHDLDHDPATAVATELTLARTYTALGELDPARRVADLAVSRARELGDASVLIDANLALGTALVARGDFEPARASLESARQSALANGSARQRADSANQLGILEDARGRPDDAARWFAVALDEIPPGATDMRGEVLNDLALIEGTRQHFARALELQQESVDILRAAHPNGHPLLAQSLSNLAVALDDAGRRDAAGDAYKAALAMRIDLLGESHPGVVMTLGSLTYHDIAGKDVDAALDHGARAWSLARALPDDHPAVGYAANLYAQALMLAHRPADAVPLLRTSLRIRKDHYAADHPLVVNTESALGLAEAESGDVEAGAALARSAYERQRAKLGDQHEMTVAARTRLDEIAALAPHGDDSRKAESSPKRHRARQSASKAS
jgi:eukaryotic-like serine/threonine-protein kinase